MQKDVKQLTEWITYLQDNYLDTNNLSKLHPIDHMLSIAAAFVGVKWYYFIRMFGITYSTPCVFLHSDEEWAKYSCNGYKTVLIVSRHSYKLLSQNIQLCQEGIVAVDNDIYKDRKGLKHAMLCFDHTISKQEYYNLIFGNRGAL